MELSEGFPPLIGPDPRILILGSLPGQMSLQEQQYYAHPRNAFWPIMADVLGVKGNYDERCRQLVQSKVALWDVLARSARPGSLDANIDMSTARCNDFPALFLRYPGILKVLFNGRKAEQLFRRLVPKPGALQVEMQAMPSTSPAFARMAYHQKRDAWGQQLDSLEN